MLQELSAAKAALVEAKKRLDEEAGEKVEEARKKLMREVIWRNTSK